MTRYRATPAIDELHTDDGGLVLLERRLVRLGPVGSIIRLTAADPATVAEFGDALVRQFGEPGGNLAALTQEAVDTLIAEGLLEACDA